MRSFSLSALFRGYFAKFRLWAYHKQPFYLLPFLIFFALKWQRKDKKVHPQYYKPHGVIVFTGLYGSGKTLSMLRHLQQLREEHPEMKIFSNFNLPFAEKLVSLKQIEQENSPTGTIFVIDEAQLTFHARDYTAFPWLMVSALTQNRKEAKLFLFSAQNFQHVDKQIRDLCLYIVECRSLGGIYFRNRWYTPPDYEKRFVTLENRPRPVKSSRFVGYPELFNQFSSLQKLTKLEIEQ